MQANCDDGYCDGDDVGIDDDNQASDHLVERGEATKRLAIQNCDWENLKAIDIM